MSNINSVHEKYVDLIIERDVIGGLDVWRGLFDQVYYSHRIGHRKPLVETFQHILDRIGCTGGECLFIDDSVQHIAGAKSSGINAYHLQVGEDIVDVLPDLLNKLE